MADFLKKRKNLKIQKKFVKEKEKSACVVLCSCSFFCTFVGKDGERRRHKILAGIVPDV